MSAEFSPLPHVGRFVEQEAGELGTTPQRSDTSQSRRGCRDSAPYEWLCTSALAHATVAKQPRHALATAAGTAPSHLSPVEEEGEKKRNKLYTMQEMQDVWKMRKHRN